MTYTPLEREDGTELSLRVKTRLRHAQELSLKNVLNRPISRRRTAAPSGTTAVNDPRLQQRGRFLSKVALSKFADWILWMAQSVENLAVAFTLQA